MQGRKMIPNSYKQHIRESTLIHAQKENTEANYILTYEYVKRAFEQYGYTLDDWDISTFIYPIWEFAHRVGAQNVRDKGMCLTCKHFRCSTCPNHMLYEGDPLDVFPEDGEIPE